MHAMKHKNEALRNNELRSSQANGKVDKSVTRENQAEKSDNTIPGPAYTNFKRSKFAERKVTRGMDDYEVSTCSNYSQLLQKSPVKYEENLKSLKVQEREMQPEQVAYYTQPSLLQTQPPSL